MHGGPSEKCPADLHVRDTNVKLTDVYTGDEYFVFLQEIASSKVTIYRGFNNTATSVHYRKKREWCIHSTSD